MGGEETKNSTLKIIVIGGTTEILQNIFPIKVENDIYKKKSEILNIPYQCRKYVQKFDKLKTEIIWEAFLIQNLTSDNLENSLEFIYSMLNIDDEEEVDSIKTNIKEEKSKFDRKYIIMKFGNNHVDNILYMLNDISRVYLPQMAIITDEYPDNSFSNILYDNRFITVIEEIKENKKCTISNIYSYLWDRENYYNERGNILNDYAPSKIIKKNEEIDSYINILVVGISRAGKSTLINLLSRKLVSLESSEGKSITTKINEYLIEREDCKIGIKLIDTPGLKKCKNEKGEIIDYTKEVIKLIEKKMKECEDSKDDIHLIYFVYEKTNLEEYIDFFKFLQKNNKNRIENNKKKIPIIFIGNKNVGKEGVDSLCKILKDNDLKDLIDKTDNKKKKIDFSKYTKNYQKKENTYNISDNIIEVNLIIDKEKNQKSYGINKILKTSLYYLKKNNPFNNYNKLEELNKNIQKFLLLKNEKKLMDKDEKDFIEYKNKVKDIMFELSEENYLLNLVKNTDDIIIKSRKRAENFIYGYMISGFAAGLIPFPFVDIPVIYSLNCIMIYNLACCYSITFAEIPWGDYGKMIFGIDTKISNTKNENDSSNVNNICNVKQIGKMVKNTAEVTNVGEKIGNEYGSNLAKKIGKDKLLDWGKRKLRFVKNGGREIFNKEIKEVRLKETSGGIYGLLEKLINIFPSMKEGAEKGIITSAESLGTEVGKIYKKNTVEITGKQLEKLCQDRCTKYAEKVSSEASKHLAKNGTTYYKFIPIIGSVIGGVLNCWGTYTVGNNAIKYFEDYHMKTLGIEYILRQINTYKTIFQYLENVSEENFEIFEFDLINTGDSLFN